MVRRGVLHYPLIVHVHALAFMGWLVLFSVQMYDLATRGRLHPACVAAFAWCLANEMAAAWLYYQLWWADFTRHLIGR